MPAHYSCYHNLQIVGNINIQGIFPITTQRSTPITDTINSQSSSSVRISDSPLFHILLLDCLMIFRAIHSRLFTIHITPLSSISVSQLIFILSHLDHTPMFKDMVYVSTIHLRTSMTHTMHQLFLGMEISQSLLVFQWPKSPFVCI